MGEPNNVLNVYMSRADRVQSVLEYYLGEPLPDDWMYEAADGFYTIRNSKGKISSRQRDILKKIKVSGGSFLLGIENQQTINLTYPFRLLELDRLAYERNIEEIQETTTSYGSDDDYKYRYKQGDRLNPVVNLTLYWGRKKWSKPLSLRDMIDLSILPEGMRELVGDYPVHLLHMRSIPDEDLQKMTSDLKYVLGMLKCSRSKKKYQEFIHQNQEYFSRIPKSAADVLDVFMNIGDLREYFQYTNNLDEHGEETTDMCKALNDIVKDAKNEGKKLGEEIGEERGKATTTLLSITNLMKNLQLTMEQAMDALEIPQNQRAKYKKLMRI